MGRRFRGESGQKVDNKGRVSIPASFRRVLAAGDPDWSEGQPANLVIVYGDHRRNHLECYTIEAIEEVDDKIAALPRGSAERRYLEKMFNGMSLETSVDTTGRLVLSKKLRDKIGLTSDSEAYFIGSGDTFQIWKSETFESDQTAGEDALFEELPEGSDPLVLLERARAD